MGLVEAAHDGRGDCQAWCERLLEGALPFFPAEVINIGLAERGEAHYVLRAGASNLPGIVEHYRTAIRTVSAVEYDPYMRFPRQVGSMNEIIGPDPPSAREAEFMKMVGARDTLGLVGLRDQYSLMVGVPQKKRVQLAHAERQLLARVALHIEAGMRLRLSPGSEVAVLHPDGRLLHAEGELRDRLDSRRQLTQHVARVEHSRARKQRQSASAVDAWSALISGHWGLIERTESDGKRHYAIIANPRARRLLALTLLEADVVELSARGLTGKAVAYALGISGPSVSHALARSAFKLGLRNRTELVRVVALLLGTAAGPNAQVSLTGAERDVLALVQSGWANAAIARARGRSERTVANQVASLLHKFGAPSRRALVASTVR